jgi:hypothetical protein
MQSYIDNSGLGRDVECTLKFQYYLYQLLVEWCSPYKEAILLSKIEVDILVGELSLKEVPIGFNAFDERAESEHYSQISMLLYIDGIYTLTASSALGG